MQTFKNLDEDLLSSTVPRLNQISIDFTLPLRIQKRALLRAIGFPTDTNLLPFRVTERRSIKDCLSKHYSKREPFLVVVSERPLCSVCTPLFLVRCKGEIMYRDRNYKQTRVSVQGLLNQISSFSKESWVEFAKILWARGTVAGRLIYENRERQLLEIQDGVVPADIGNRRDLAYFLSELSHFDCESSFNFDRIKLREVGFNVGFPREVVRKLCDRLSSFANAFEILRGIAPLPTLEFAYVNHRRLVAIDIDWPSQWIRGEVVRKETIQAE